MRRSELVSLALAFMIPLGCGGSDNSSGTVTDPSLTCTVASNGTFSATMNGQAWAACGKVSVQTQTAVIGKDTLNTVSWAGTGFFPGNVAYAVVMSASRVGKFVVGAYPVGPTNPAGSNLVVGSSDNSGWGANAVSGSGTITVTAYSANHITGTFSFSAPRVPGVGAATLQVTNGTFDLSY